MMMIGLGSMTFLAACDPVVDQTIALEALRDPLIDLGGEVQRIDDAPLTAAYRNVAATWQAGLGL